jgi:hypothetical protein
MSGYQSNIKSETRQKKDEWIAKMEPLLKKKVRMVINGSILVVRFTRYGNNHLYSNAVWKGSPIQTCDLPEMDLLLAKSQYVKCDSAKERHDGIISFYYFKVELKGITAYLNVASRVKNKGSIETFLYAVTAKLKETENG